MLSEVLERSCGNESRAFIMSAKRYTDGCRLDAFRTGMLSDRYIATLSDYRMSDVVFPTASVNGIRELPRS